MNQNINPHEFTQNTRLYFEKLINKIELARKSNSMPSNYLSILKSIHRGRLVCRRTNCFNVTVSENLVNRAILFLDCLAKELENRKFKIQFHHDNAGNFVAVIRNNEMISFHIFEGYKYHPIKNDLRSELEKLLYRDNKPIPTGKLTFAASARETNISKTWSDDARLIEDKLPNIIDAFDSLVIKQNQRRIEIAIKAEQRRENVRIFRENESRVYLEKSIYDSAMQESQGFIAQINLESYLNYLEAQYMKEYGSFNEATLLWFTTARKIAETQSPARKRLKLLSAL
jgi:hypothetical protein